MDSYDWAVLLKKVIIKTEENKIVRKFLDSNFDKPTPELCVEYKKNYVSTSPDAESHRYLTPIANPKFRLTTKKYDLPESKKAQVITLSNADVQSGAAFSPKESPKSPADLTPKSPLYVSIGDNSATVNESAADSDRTENAGGSVHEPSEAPIKRGILKTSKQSITDTSASKSCNERFVVNLYENRSSKRWKTDGKALDSSNVTVKSAQFADLSGNPEDSARSRYEDHLPNATSSTEIYDLIMDLKRNINNSRSTNGPVDKIIQNLDDDTDISNCTDERNAKIRRTSDMQSQIMVEATKILQMCLKLKKFYASAVHVEAEKVLLLASIRYNNLIRKTMQNEYEYTSKAKIAVGSVILNNIRFQLNMDYETTPNWFLCVVSNCDKVFASAIIPALEGNYIEISDEFQLEKLDWNFEIDIELYGMKLPKFAKQKHRFFAKKKDELRASLKKLRHKDLKTNVFTDDLIADPSFKLCGKAKIVLKHAKHNQVLEMTPLVAWLDKKFSLDVHLGAVEFKRKWVGFLTVGKDSTGCIVWNRRWCVLNGYKISFYNYPSDESYIEPLEAINLKNILYPYLIAANRNVCARSRTVLLHIGNARKRNKFYINADTNEDFKEFKGIVEDVINCLKHWNLQTYPDNL